MSVREAMRGTLAEGALAPLVGGLQRARASGWLLACYERYAFRRHCRWLPSLATIMRSAGNSNCETSTREDQYL